MRIAVVLALLTACGRFGFDETPPDAAVPPVVPPPPEYASGTRLRAEVHEVNGARVFVTWYDTMLGEECQRRVTEDGVMRCIPTRISVGAQYSDAACTTHLLASVQPSDQTDCPTALVLASQQIGARFRVVQVGAKYFGTVYQNTNDTCVQLGTSTSIDLYDVGATVPPETFVAFHEERTPSGAFEYIEYVADDGARELASTELHVTQTNRRCELELVSSNRMACVDKSATGFLAYADAACTEPAYVTEDEYMPYGLTYASTTCEDDIHRVALGEALPTYYALVNGTGPCTEQTLGGGQYHVFRATPDDTSPIIDRAALVPRSNTGDVVGSDWIFTAGQRLPAGFYDRRHGDQCVVTNTLTDRVCAPIWTGYQPVFSDATCTMQLEGPPKCRGNWRSIWYPAGSLGVEWRCEGLAETIRLYDQPIAPPYYEKTGDACTLGDPLQLEPRGMNANELPVSEMSLVTRHMD
jgi:hypothetical protein